MAALGYGGPSPSRTGGVLGAVPSAAV